MGRIVVKGEPTAPVTDGDPYGTRTRVFAVKGQDFGPFCTCNVQPAKLKLTMKTDR